MAPFFLGVRVPHEKDITGFRFTKLVAVGKHDHKKWVFKCDCGIERPITKQAVTSGRQKSCGCYGASNQAFIDKRADLTGMTFGMLKVVGEAPRRNRLRYWLCSCECGGVKEVYQHSLTNGRSRSCGCINKQTKDRHFNLKDLRGQTFGRLLVLDIDRDAAGPKTKWICKCECGKQKSVVGQKMKDGSVRSCGCLKSDMFRQNIAGKRFGILTAIEPTDRKADNSRSIVWRFSCDCGGEKFATVHAVNVGHTASCGCAKGNKKTVRTKEHREKQREYVRNRYKNDIKFNLNVKMQSAVRSALQGKKRGRLHLILGYTIEELERRLKETMPQGYCWDDVLNGALEIDHIIPKSVFNYEYETDMDFKRCWALSNLQLLPARENLDKRAKLDAPFQPGLGF